MSIAEPVRRQRHEVSSRATASLTYRVFVRQIVTRGRLVALGILGALIIVVGWAVGISEATVTSADSLDHAVHLTINLGLTIVVPVVSLVFAAGVLGDARDDGTLVYLWLRPLRRWPVALGAYGSALTIIAPLTIVPVVAAAAMIDHSSEVVVAVALTTTLAVIGYTGLFVLLGAMLRKSIVWGLAYIIVWEDIASSIGKSAARLSIRGYAGSVLTERTGVAVHEFDFSQGTGVIVMLVVAVVAVVLTGVRLNRVDVA